MLLFLLIAASEGGGCTADKQCEAGLVCRANLCVLVGTGDQCKSDDDCRPGLGCSNDVCVKSGAATPPAQPRSINRPILRHGNEPVPPGAIIVHKPHFPLIISGVTILAATSLLTGAVVSFLCTKGCVPWATGVSWLPLVGPVADGMVSTPEVLPFMLTMIITQAAGAGMMIAGLFVKRDYFILPMVGGNQGGLSMTGRF